MLFRQIYDRKLAQYAYLIGCQATGEAIIIDPMRDVERYMEMAEQEGLRLVAAAETHIHADYLSGLREIAERAGVAVYASAEGGPDWQYQWFDGGPYAGRLVRDGAQFSVGNIRFDVIHTPGHTPEHICFLVTDTGGGADRPMGVLSGDFVFVGDVGRPDLLETAAGQTGAMEPSARQLYHSLQRFHELADYLQVWPGHGAGSACGKSLGAVPSSTVGYEKSFNASLLAASTEEGFVSYILDGQPEPPIYFARMKQQNRSGPAVLGALPRPRQIRTAKFEELSGATGVAVIDTRSWEMYREGHLPGALWAPIDRATFNTVAGCYVPGDMAMYLIIEEDRLEEAVVDLVHVGLDQVAGWATPDMFREFAGSGGAVDRVREIDAAGLEERVQSGAYLLDVRRAAELTESGRIGTAKNIAHTRLLERIGEVPKDEDILIYCGSGIRSAYACGLLDRFGYRTTNVAGGIEAWRALGGEVNAA